MAKKEPKKGPQKEQKEKPQKEQKEKPKKKRRARGEGSICKRPDGTWEALYVAGIDPGTGKRIRKTVYAKTQQEVRKKLTAAIAALDNGDYKEPCKMTLAQWLDIWTAEYLNAVRPRTVEAYLCQIKNHIKPNLGAVKLDALNPHTIQKFYNGLGKETAVGKGLSAKSIKNIHGILHRALQQAVAVGYIRSNPAEACTLPKVVRKELKPLDEDATALFIDAIKGHRYETVFLVTLFTGMRQGEVLGLTWDCVDFTGGTLTINKQLQKTTGGGSVYVLVPTKNGKGRVIAPAAYVMDLLRSQYELQNKWKLDAGPLWEESNLVFTDELGKHFSHHTIYQNFKRVVASIGFPDVRFHDLRHSFAVASIRAGDDIKTVQGNLGHATAAFTLDVYGHVTDKMKHESADRMQAYIDGIRKNKSGK